MLRVLRWGLVVDACVVSEGDSEYIYTTIAVCHAADSAAVLFDANHQTLHMVDI